MKRSLSLTLAFVTLIISACSSSSADDPKQPNESLSSTKDQLVAPAYELVWGDEFDYEGTPMADKWHFQIEPITDSGWANNELQHYTNRLDNALVSDGTLKIIAKREDYTYGGMSKEFTSARLNAKFDFTYGKVEVRAKLPAAAGTWPAIWTLGSNIDEKGNYFGNSRGSVGWPHCGEIDIMEQYGGNKNETLGTFHWHDTGTNAYATYGLKKSITGLTENFHNYVLVWDADRMDIYVDETLVVRMNNAENVPFDNPHYLLLNVAMGGSLGGPVSASFEQDQMEIDYVRIYQLKN
jgi:beta-glucanase (GH16 family)